MKNWLLWLPAFFTLSIQAQWWPDVRVSYDNWNSISSLRKCIDSTGDTVYVTWYQQGDYKASIYFARSTDAGLHWDNQVQITNEQFDAVEPVLQVSGSVIHIVWMDYRDGDMNNVRIYYKRSTDYGLTWEEDVQLTAYGGIKWYPELAVSGNCVHLIWYDQCNDEWEVFYMRSTDNGETWGERTRLTNNPGLSVFSSIAASGPVLHICWHDNRDGNKEIYYKRSGDGGLTWSDDKRLTFSEGDSRIPEIDVCDPFVHVVWQDKRDGDYSIYYIGSNDCGITWGQEIELTYEANTCQFPSVVAAGKVSHVVWQEYADGQSQIFYKCSPDGGMNWSENLRLVNTLYDAFMPSVCYSNEWLHVFWYDYRNGSSEVYCKNEYIQTPETGQFAYTPFEFVPKEVYVNKYKIDSLRVYNYGNIPLRIDSVYTDSPFSISLDTINWTHKIKDFDILPGYPFGKTTFYTRFDGILPGNFSDSISMVIEDSIFYISEMGICKEAQGINIQPEELQVVVYPNPFTFETWINVALENKCDLTFDVFNSNGSRVDHFIFRDLPKGSNSITWKQNSLPSGLYFYRLDDGKRQFNGRLILLDN